ncbi:scopoletin 8-hydroxylase-like [Impatiens glandulifera]|uniref:scopoletin 8-hydroxylase-like n=1 Tax=Impatiens glandulifera TaxID=253017 RepID=UPI001FB16155|nr:scopoletin 8-hydroxylase-like [Impatiens glandulifera]
MAPLIDNNVNSLFEFVVRDGKGVKGLVDLGISTVPEQYIQPPKERISLEKLAVIGPAHQPIDLSGLDGPNRDEVVEAIVHAAETLGFFQVVNHGVPLRVLDTLKDTAHMFFAQEAEKKAIYLKEVSPSPLVKYGTSFLPEKERALEWKDYISMMYTNDDEALQQWPDNCKEVVLEYLKASNILVRKLVEILIQRLESKREVPDGLIGLKMVNMNFYPACPNPELTVGVGRHSDMGTITVLLQDGIGGLYVKLEQETNDHEFEHEPQWMEIPPVDGALVINIGDSLQILSNGKYKSAEHRVRTTSKESRVSIPVFTAPHPTYRIGPLPELVKLDGVARYKEVLFGDYMKNFFGNTHDGKKSLEFARVDDSP